MNGPFCRRRPRREAPDLPFAVLAIALVMLAGCGGRDVAPTPTEAPAMPGAGPGSEPSAGDGMTPKEMARKPGPRPAGEGGELDVAPGRLQSIGVRFGRATRRSLNRDIRTVGRVAMDEGRLARVNVKIEGWIDRLYVNTTGQQVTRGQPLFTLYSPELVATQEEYVLALRSARTLGTSEFPEVSAGAKSMLEAARRRFQLWDIADSHIRALEQSGTVFRTLPIHAPLGGTVIEKMAVAGMKVMPGEDLYVIADLSHVWVLADVYEYELPHVQVGQAARITSSYDPAARLTGRLAFVYPTVDPETRTATARFELANPDGKLKPGMFVDVSLTVPLGERLIVPKDAVLESGPRQIIFVRRGGGKLAWRQVKIGARAGDWVEIVEGLTEGEEVVTSANFLIDSESQVKGAMAGMPGMDAPGGADPKGGDRPESPAMPDMPGMAKHAH